MSTLTYTRPHPMIKFVFPPTTSNLGQTYKMRITSLHAGPMQIENAMGTRPDNGRDPLPGGKRQKALAQGV
jgi:hypothetical protein